MFRNYIFRIFLSLLMSVFVIGCYDKAEAADNLRHKNRVLLVVNNLANTKHDDALTKMINDELHKKIDVIYNEEDSQEFSSKFQGKSWIETPIEDVLSNLTDSKSNYFIYAELVGIKKRTHYNLLYHGKTINTSFYIRLIDIKQKKVYYATEYEVSASDSTDSFFVGSASVSKKALQSALFRAGEVISVHLPL